MISVVSSIAAPREPQPDKRPFDPARVVRDGIANYSATIFSACTGLIMVPILLDGLGAAAYGLLITSLMVGSMIPVDMGLGWALTHEIASGSADHLEGADPFVGSAGWLFLIFGGLGSALVIAFGFYFARLHAANSEPAHTTRLVFILAGVGFLGEHMLIYTLSVLHGLRRFGSANLLLIVSVLVRALGSYVLLRLGKQVLAIAGWQATIAALTGLFGTVSVSHLHPVFKWRFHLPEGSDIQRHLRLAFSGLATMTATSWLWQCTPLLAGLMRGASSVVPFYVGQRFPLGISMLNWKAAEPIFPAASAVHDQADQRKRVFFSGTRWITAVSLPLCLFLWMEGSTVLRLWIGDYPTGALLILRLTTVAVFADSLGVSAIHLLLAVGSTRSALATALTTTLATVLLSFILLYFFDPAYAVWALVIPMLVGTLALLWFARLSCGFGLRDIARLALNLCFPSAVFVFVLWVLSHLGAPHTLSRLFAIGMASGISYVVVLLHTAFSAEERDSAKRFLMTQFKRLA